MRLLLSILWRKERPASCNRPALTQPHPHLVHRNGKPRSASQAPGGGQGRRKRERPGKASVRRRNRERRRRPGGECAGAPFPGTFTSRCRPRPGARGAARGGLANRASMFAATPLASPSPTRRRAVARPFQGRVSRQRLKAPGLNADHRRRVRTDSSNCSVRKSKPCIQARSGTTLASLAFAIG